MLHDVVPKLYCNDLLLLRNTYYEDGPTCDDDLIKEFEQDFALNYSIQVLLLSFIFLLDRY
jgi:hypothetical protein